MPQIGWFEILLIVVISILVVGPKDFPIMLRKIGQWINTFKRYFSDIQTSISNFHEDIDTDEKKEKLKDKKEDIENERK